MFAVSMLAIVLATCYITANATADVSPNPARAFGMTNRKRLVGVSVREVIPAGDGSRSPLSHCAVACYKQQWCQSFNIIHSTGQCELFDSKASAEQMENDSDSLYGQKTSDDLRDCEPLSVINGVDVADDTAHQDTANISCDDGYLPIYNYATCEDGVFIIPDPITDDRTIEYAVCINDIFRTYPRFRRTADPPDETVSLVSRAEGSIVDCADECRDRQWCTGFNVNHQSGQCEMFRKFRLGIPISKALVAASEDDVAGVINQPIPAEMPTDGLRNGSRLIITFRTLDALPAGSIDALIRLASGADIALKILIRLAKSIVTCNSAINGVWGVAETSGGSPLTSNNLFTLEVVNRGPHFELIVNGNTFTTYAHRKDPYTINSFRIYGNLARDPFECRLEYE